MSALIVNCLVAAAAVLATFGSRAGAAPETRVVCPAELPDAALRTGPIVDGWRPYKASPLMLHSAAPTGGPPELQADLAEFTTIKTKKGRIDTYDLGAPHPHGIWMKCGYGTFNEVTLHKQLDDRIRQCKLTTFKDEPVVIDIVCT